MVKQLMKLKWKKSKKEQDFWSSGKYFIRIYGDEIYYGNESDNETIKGVSYPVAQLKVKQLMKMLDNHWKDLV